MLEKLGEWLLQKYLGEYIEGLDKNNLKFGLGSGNIVLENLSLKDNVLDFLDLPITMKYGYLKKLSLTIPWKHLTSKPTTIKLEGIYLLASPKNPNAYDEKTAQEKIQSSKQSKLEKWEMMKQKTQEDKSDSFGVKLGTKIASNLQFEISNIHIRLEDDATDPKNPFTMGITLEKLHGFSTDQNWKSAWIELVDVVHKLIELKNLSVYWNCHDKFLSPDTFPNSLVSLIPTDTQSISSHHYVVEPISAQLKVQYGRDLDFINAGLDFTTFGIILEDQQYQNVLDMVQRISWFQKAVKYQKFKRPPKPIKKDKTAKAWWKFAYTAIISDIKEKKEKFSWKYMLKRIKDRNQYIALYTKKLSNQKLNKNEEEIFKFLEITYNYEDLVFFRTVAQTEFKKIKEEKKKTKKEKSTGFFSRFKTTSSPLSRFKSDKSEKTDQKADKVNKKFKNVGGYELSDEELNELYNTIEYDKPLKVPKITARLNLPKVSFTIKKKTSPLTQVLFNQMNVSLDLNEKTLMVKAGLGSFSITDLFSQNTKFPLILSSASSNTDQKLLDFSFEMNLLEPNPSEPVFAINLNAQSLHVYFNIKYILELVYFFTITDETLKEELELIAASQLVVFRNLTKDQLLTTIYEQKKFTMNIQIKAPTILFPEDTTNENSSIFVVDLGKLSLVSKPIEKNSIFDKFACTIASIHILSVQTKKDLANKDKAFLLLEPFDVELQMILCRFETEEHPAFALQGTLPNLNFCFTPKRLESIFKFIKLLVLEIPLSVHINVEYLIRGLQIPEPPGNKQVLLKKKLADINLLVPQISLSLVDDQKHKNIVVLKLIETKFQIVKRSYDVIIDLSLKELEIEDHLETDPNNKKLITSSNSADKILELHLKDFERESPEYNLVDTEIQLKIDSLLIMFNQKTVVQLIEIILPIMTELEKIPSVRSDQSPLTASFNKQKSKLASATKPKKKVVALQMKPSLKSITVILNKHGQKLAQFSINRINVFLKLYIDDTIFLNGSVEKIEGVDLNPQTIFKQAICVPIQSFSVETFTPGSFYDVKIALQIENIFFIFLSRFFASIAQFFNEAQAMRTILSSTATLAAEKGKEVAEALIEKAIKVGLDIKIQNLQVYVPQNSNLDSCVIVNLQSLNVSNDIANNKDTIRADIYGFSLVSGKHFNPSATKSSIIEKINLHAVIIRPLTDIKSQSIQISIQLTQINISFNKSQLILIFSILGDNLIEGKEHIQALLNETSVTSEVAHVVSKPSPIRIELKAELNSINLDLIKSSERGFSPLVQFNAKNLKLNLTQTSDINLKFSLSSITLVDQREEAKDMIFKNILYCKEEASQLEIVFINDKLNITFSNPCILVVIDTVISILDFIFPIIPLIVLQMNKLIEVFDVPSTKKNSSPEIIINVVKPQIFLIQDMNNPNSQVLRVEADIQLHYHEKKIQTTVIEESLTVQVKEFQIFRCRFKEDEEFWSILEPLNLNLHLRIDGGLELVSSIQGIHILVSYQDIKFIHFLVNRALQNPLIKNLTLPEDSMKLQIKKTNQREKIMMNIDSIVIGLVNDCRDQNVPVADLFILQVHFELSNWSSSMLLLTNFNISANYFNLMNLTYEPIMEIIIQGRPFFQLVGKRHSINEALDLSLTTESKLDLNVTIPFLNSLITIATTWIEDLTNLNLTPPSEFVPFFLQNETGSSFTYWIKDNGPQFTLNNSQRAPLVSEEPISKTHRRISWHQVQEGAKSSFTLCIREYPNALFLCRNVPYDKIGLHLIDKENLIFSEVSFKKGAKTASIHSNIKFVNHLKAALQIEVTLKHEKLTQTIEHSKHYYVPIFYTKEGDFRVKTESSQWSAYISLNATNQEEITIKGNNQGSTSFNFIAYRKISSTMISIEFLPIIRFKNAFPVPINIKVLKVGPTLIQQKEILPEEHIDFYELDPTAQLDVSIQLEGFQWSSPFSLASSKSGSVELLDIKNRIFKAEIDLKKIHERRKFTFYCPYWIINNTKQEMIYGYDEGKSIAAGPSDNAPPNPKNLSSNTILTPDLEIPPFLFSPPKKSKLCFRIGSSEFSEGLSLNSKGLAGIIELKTDKNLKKSSNSQLYEVAINVTSHPNQKFWRSQLVIFSPRFLIVNKMKEVLYFKQLDTTQTFSISPQDSQPFHWFDHSKPKFLQISFQPSENWSGFFSIDTIQQLVVGIKTSSNEKYFARVDIKVNGPCTLILFFPESKDHPPYRIDNLSSKKITFNQLEVDFRHEMKGKSSAPFTWDQPTKLHKIEVMIEGEEKRRINLDKFKRFKKHGKFLQHEVYPEGPIKVLKFFDSSDSQIKIEKKSKPKLFLNLNLKAIGISIMNLKEEILYLTLEGIHFKLYDSTVDQKIELIINELQLDNTQFNPIFPVAIIPKVCEERQPVFHFSSIQLHNSDKRIEHFEYFSVLLQELEIKLDEELITRILTIVDKLDIPQASNKLPDLSQKENEEETSLYYFRMFHINPIRVYITFITVEGMNEKYSISLSKKIKIPSRLIANIDNAPLKLNGLLLEHPFVTKDDLQSRITSHYITQAIRQIYLLLGSFEFLGSPVNLISNLGTGVYDFFHEPAKGITQSPLEFGKGVAKGVASLAKNFSYGIFNTTSKVTGSIASGVAMLSFDQDYIKKREEQNIKDQPKHAAEGVLYGVRDLGMGIFKGVTGIAHEPYKAIKEKEGVGSILKGFGRGLVGVAVKPTVGAIDLATQTTKGIRNTATFFDEKSLRKRYPRYIPLDGSLSLYNPDEAEAQHILTTLHKGKYQNEKFLYHKWFLDGKERRLLLVSEKHLLFRRGEKFTKVWKIKFKDLASVQLKKQSQTIVFNLRNESSVSIECQQLSVSNEVLTHVTLLLKQIPSF